ncbi:SpoIIE family protein phosphatase [Streptomyces sp. NPDC002763]|uniref:SpoIIE family protein phosphatase n=1 Tax=Streptomyces sp. NPDC002763 TaxID=3154427 RepID=UPI003320D82A
MTAMVEGEDVAWFRAGASLAVAARGAAATLARRTGLSDHRAAEVALAVTEAATNVQRHAVDGALLLRVVRSGDEAGVEFLTVDSRPGLGLGLPHPPPTVLRAPPGTRLLMITDGLVEIRTAHLNTTLAEFSEAVANGPEDLEKLCDLLLARFGHNKDDDIALIAALFTERAPPRHSR